MAGTLIRIFLETVSRHRKPAQFVRKRDGRWEAVSAEAALADVERLALGLRHFGVGRGDHVAILSESRCEWAISDLAILGLGAVSVPIYSTLTAQQCRFILENSEAKVAIVSTAEQLAKVVALLDDLPRLGAVVAMDAAGNHPKVRSWSETLAQGEQARAAAPDAFRAAAEAVEPGDLATIIYTSGTTGEPKGAMLTHSNIASNVEACLKVVELRPDDTSLSFLPLSHIFERMAGLYAMLAGGVTIAYAESLDTVAADAIEVKPTVLTGVPRFYEKVYARVTENAAKLPLPRRLIFNWGLGQGVAAARAHFAGRTLRSFGVKLADHLVGAKIRERVGGRLRFCISGGAPLSPQVMEFFFAVGIPVIEGYGLTETSPVICLNPPGKEKPGAVGPPVPGVEVRIGEEGEILTRGPHVMKGYFSNDAATAQALRDGWFHTGDIGHLDADGYLVITDRLKDLLVTAGGKKVAPQPLEGKLKASRWVTEAVLIGDRRPCVAALIVPNFERLEQLAKAQGWSHATRAELLARPEVRGIYQRRVDRLNAGLAPFEQVKTFALLDRDLTLEAGELTPTLKVKRRILMEKFRDVIEQLYHASPAPPGA
ncbi:MAG: long-chain fatty acid--CoA ligase [Candidatus Eisenbacteria bacterium]|nr:long-chain fatty acid--CoA ligase [Candidatus Eisenbacteria bacterium]